MNTPVIKFMNMHELLGGQCRIADAVACWVLQLGRE